MSRRRERSAKQPGAPYPPTGSWTPIHCPDPSAGRETDTPPEGVRSCHVSADTGTRSREASLGRLAHLPCSILETLSVLCHTRARGDFSQAVLLIARYQGAKCSRWYRPRHARQSATPVRHDRSATEYHNAYAVDPTVYAATYTASTGASPMGQVKTPLGQRVYRAMKRIQKEIHKALLMSF